MVARLLLFFFVVVAVSAYAQEVHILGTHKDVPFGLECAPGTAPLKICEPITKWIVFNATCELVFPSTGVRSPKITLNGECGVDVGSNPSVKTCLSAALQQMIQSNPRMNPKEFKFNESGTVK